MARMTRERSDDEQRAHLAIIAQIKAAWRNNEIGAVEKRRRIVTENKHYYGGTKRGETGVELTAMPASDNMPYLLAESVNVPVEVARHALNARRAAVARAQLAPTKEQGEAIRDEGVRRYQRILEAGKVRAPDVQDRLPAEDLAPGRWPDEGES